MVRVRGKRTRLAGSGETRGPGGAVEGLLQGTGGGDRGDRRGDDGGGWEDYISARNLTRIAWRRN